MKKIIYLIICILLLSLVYANEECYINKECVWYSVILNETDLMDNITAKITIQDDNVTLDMFSVTKGIFKYNITYYKSGIKLGCTTFYNSTNVSIGTDCESRTIRDDDMNFFTIFFVFGILICVCLYVSKILNSKYKLAKLIFFLYSILLSFTIVFEVFNSNSSSLKDIFLFLMLPFIIFNGIYWLFVYTGEQIQIKKERRLGK